VLVRVARWDALGSALKEDVRVRLAVSTMALPGDTPYAPGAGAIRRFARAPPNERTRPATIWSWVSLAARAGITST